MKQAIEPMYECRNDMAIFADLAARLGINDDDDRTEEQWLRELTRGAVDDFAAFRGNGVACFAPSKDAVAFAAQIRDPDNHKLTTPSGKIEIYFMAMAQSPILWLGRDDADPDLVRPGRAGCQIPADAVQPEVAGPNAWMNPADAWARGISDGQTMRIFNDRGSTLLPVKVTPRIAQGVVSIKEGAWFTPDADGPDTAGLC